MSRIEKAISCFKGDFNCAQSVMNTYSAKYGLDRNTALKLATGFGGGMGRLGNTCGAVTGAFMVIGLKYGMGINEEIELKEKTYQFFREFSNLFKKINGSIICKDLLGLNINTAENRNHYIQNELFEKRCLQYVKNTAEILEELL